MVSDKHPLACLVAWQAGAPRYRLCAGTSHGDGRLHNPARTTYVGQRVLRELETVTATQASPVASYALPTHHKHPQAAYAWSSTGGHCAIQDKVMGGSGTRRRSRGHHEAPWGTLCMSGRLE